MPVTIDHFSNLRERFPTWDEMRAHLTSKEGGSLRVVEPPQSTSEEHLDNLVVIRYVKGKSDLRSPTLGTGLFRSVVWDTVTNRPVCFAPAKATEGNPALHTPFSAVEEFVDGVMVNAFVYESDPTTLHLVTRTTLGAGNTFYSEKTFATLFDECLAATPVRTRAALLMHLREQMSRTGRWAAYASFVIQHPEHRIVAKAVSPDLNMVHMGTINGDGVVENLENPGEWPAPLKRLQITRYPVRQFHTEQEITDLMRRTAVQNGFRWQGLVFKDDIGTRWRLRSPSYTQIRTLRGAEANQLDRFLRLRRDGTVRDYLKHYGEERNEMWAHETTLRARTADVLAAYEAVHKAHSMKFGDLPAAYKPAVHLLHVTYLEELRAKRYTVQLSNAIQVVNGLKDFEQKRLMEAEPFVAPAAESPAPAPTS